MKLGLIIPSLLFLAPACFSFEVESLVEYAVEQYTRLASTIEPSGVYISTGDPLSSTWHTTDHNPWTAGFYCGSLWMLFKLTSDEKWKELALANQEGLRERQYDTGTHDVGFVIMSSFGHGLELTGDQSFESVVENAANSLATRFIPVTRVFRSWNNYGADDQNEVKCIIDNMMNLNLMFKATELTGNQTFKNMAISHADRTIEEHYRPDWGSFHVVAYDEITGEVLRKYTAQGYSDNSTWSRGHAWGIFGYTETYKNTKDAKYLEIAINAADYFIAHLPEDYIPYWDFAVSPSSPRDTSAASISACAFLELYKVTKYSRYLTLAESIIDSLSSTSYLSNGIAEYRLPSILVNGTVFYNQNDYNTAITYGDYYFLRALDIYKNL